MEAAQAAIARHTSRRGHFTDVEEHVRPAVTSETIKPHRHEITTEAYDREVHQHHYHTTVQPLSHREVLPENHTHNLIPMRKTEHHHEDKEENQRKLAEFAAMFRDMSITHETTHSKAHQPAVIGEHVHHHVHEVVQPIIYKETHQRETVHTTVPIHEVHHQKAMHHGLSSLPMKTMEEFHAFNSGRKAGEVRHSSHEGAPREYDSKLATTFEKLGMHSHHGANTRAAEPSPSLPPIDTNSRTTQGPTTTTTTTSALRNPVTPTRRAHRRSTSSSSSASDSVPTTPTSPKYRNEMLPKNNIMNTMALNNEGAVTSPTHNVDTYTPNSHINTQTTTTSKVNRVPSKTVGGDRPVKIVGNGNDGELSPRYSSDDATPARRSFMGRLTGSNRRVY